MGILDYIILGVVGTAFLAAVRFLKKNGNRCSGCKGDCSRCSGKK